MTPARLKQLIFLYRNSSLTDGQRDELISGLKDHQFPDLFSADVQAIFDSSDETLWDAQLDNEIWQAVQQGVPVAGKSRLRRMPAVWVRYAAAAILLLTAGAGIYFFGSSSPEIKTVATGAVRHSDIQPGGNKAYLTLGDGSTIVLDSAADGQLANQGNTKIIKLPGGALAYNAGVAGQNILYNTICTPKGGQYQIVLPDGSKVWLNAASSICFPTAFVNERRVSISGEVYFEIEKNAKMPFIVKIDRRMEVEVLGTAFNVMAYTDEASVNTTLLQGSVRVIKANRNTLLQPGEQARVADEVTVVKNADVNKAIAWKNGLLNFEKVGLREMMRQLERWYDIEVVYEGNVPDVKFFGKMSRKVQLSTVLDALKGFGVHFKNIEGRKIIVTP